jgi:hypothetical protein
VTSIKSEVNLLAAQDIPLNGSEARIRRCSVYAKSGAVVEETRADSREGVLRSQLTISPDGHCHIRCALRTHHFPFLPPWHPHAPT